jgi:hypothetical protein
MCRLIKDKEEKVRTFLGEGRRNGEVVAKT